MNIFSHFRISKILLHYLSHNHGIKIKRTPFIFGNLKPDICADKYNHNHSVTIMDDVLNELEHFLTDIQSERLSESAFAEKLGTFCHYLSDFFCLAHNASFSGDMWKHHEYEFKLHKHIRRIKAEKYNSFITAGELKNSIINQHEKYSQEALGLANDSNYIATACVLVCTSTAKIWNAYKRIRQFSEMESVNVIAEPVIGQEAIL